MLMMAKRLLAGVLCIMLTAQAFSTISHAATVKGEGSASTETDFDSTGLFNNDLIVMIPDEVPLTLNEESGRLEGKGFVTAWGNAGARTQLSVSTDRDITYVLEDDNNITVDADVSFGDTENNTAVWDSAVLRDNIEASQKTGEYVFASVPLSAIDNIGTYRSDILFNIFMDSRAGSGGSGDSGDSTQNVEMFSYEETNYNGIKGYSLTGFSPEGVSYIENCEDESITLQFPDTYNGKPVLRWNGNGGGAVFPDWGKSSITNIKFVLGRNFKIINYITYGIQNGFFDSSQCKRSIICNEGLQEISARAFYHADGLDSIILPDTITSIGKNAFYECLNLKSVRIPSSVEIVSENAFSKCTSLENVVFDEGFSGEIGKSAFSYSGITDLAIPALTENVGDSAFACCESLEKLTFDEDFSGTIGREAFSNTDIRDVTIPALTASIGAIAFYQCENLKNVTFADGFNCEISTGVFRNTAVIGLSFPSSFMHNRTKLSEAVNVSNTSGFGSLDGVRKLTFDSNSNDFSVDYYREYLYYSFNDKDFICYNNSFVEVPKGLMNEDCNFEFISNEMLNGCSEDFINLLIGYKNSFNGSTFNGVFENCGYIILKEGITDIGVPLVTARISIPSTLETVSCEYALGGGNFVGTADLRGVSGMDYDMYIMSADKYITNSSKLTINGSDVDDIRTNAPTIKELYIEYDDVPAGRRMVGLENIGEIYFSGTEEEWQSVSEKLSNWSSFKGEIHYNASF